MICSLFCRLFAIQGIMKDCKDCEARMVKHKHVCARHSVCLQHPDIGYNPDECKHCLSLFEYADRFDKPNEFSSHIIDLVRRYLRSGSKDPGCNIFASAIVEEKFSRSWLKKYSSFPSKSGSSKVPSEKSVDLALDQKNMYKLLHSQPAE